MHSFWFISSLSFFFLLTFICTNSSSTPSSTVSYSDHCSSFVPESTTTSRILRPSALSIMSSYFTGGNKLLAPKEGNQTYYLSGKFLKLRILPNYYQTTTQGVYKVEAVLNILYPNRYLHNHTTSTFAGSSYYNGGVSLARRSVRFLLTGYWSEISRRLCLVGSASRPVDGFRIVNLEAVLKLNYASENPDIYTGVVSGTLKSTSPVNDPAYFNPVFIFTFPELSNYNYSLVSKISGGGYSPDTHRIKLCRTFRSVLEMQYEKASHSLLGQSSGFLALTPFQCSWHEEKIRFLAFLQNVSYVNQEFGIDSTFIGEASWDDKNNELSGIACRLLNPDTQLGRAVGDCTMGLSLKYNTVWTIRSEPKVVGQFSSTKSAQNSGYFGKVNLTSFDLVDFPDLRYKYIELGRAKNLCPVNKPVKKGSVYPLGLSEDMRFDLYAVNSKGKEIAWGYAKPISIGNNLFDRSRMVFLADTIAPESAPEISSSARNADIAPTNISYNIFIHAYKAEIRNLFPNLNLSVDSQHRLGITAEGTYYAKTGYLCMVACGQLTSYGGNTSMTSTSMDCEILVKFVFAPLNDKKGGRIKGVIESTRGKSDPLYFKDLKLSSAAYYGEEAEKSIWRMDFEITMVLISNMLLCVFIGLQILHVKRNPAVLSRISLVMLVVLCLGHMIPLVLNFDAVFLANHNKQTVSLSSGGWIEANEVAVRVITMVAFLLQIRLAQLVWTAKQDENNEKGSCAGERKCVFVTLTLYVSGGLLAVVWNKCFRKYSVWGDLRSYVGFILDGFLFPQILLNIFGGSAAKALGEPFYVGTSLARVVPHAYNQYREHNYPAYDVNGTYYYANPGADYYSTAWDVLIPCVIIGFAVITFVQQRNGGRWILPRRFREVELYEKSAEVFLLTVELAGGSFTVCMHCRRFNVKYDEIHGDVAL
ncbi:Protein of unknown function (DUF2921 [Striga hermonthica]|uniref:RING-type E3 ubiquitin transferase n=1 Tax=Striga hermonthica TaxID=68872 RepID=A0A9N7MLB7_STRHE|nr:Protein of unknown function (DUF2921 [Striga hermonthica]